MKGLLYMFRRYRMATILNLLGLGVAVAAFYLLMTQVIYNRTYNYNIASHERVVRFEINGGPRNGWGDQASCPFIHYIEDVPHVEAVVIVSPYTDMASVKVGNKEMNMKFVSMGKPGVEFFSGRMLYGSSREWREGATVILNRSTALQMFGTDKAVGKTFIAPMDGEKVTASVVGVCEDMPDNCTIPNGIYICIKENELNDWSEWSYNLYARLDNSANISKVEHGIKLAMMKANGFDDEKQFEKEIGLEFRLTPVDDIYFSGLGISDNGNRNLVDVLAAASLFVLVIAMLNLLNFSLSEVPVRMRGINTRRMMGASVARLRWNMILENVMFAAVGLAVGVVLIVAFGRSEQCMKLVSGNIAFSAHIVLTIVMVLAALAVGMLSAVFPAVYSTSFAPAMVLKGAFGLSPRGRRLRMTIMAVQFCVAFALAIYIGVMVCQSHYIFSSDYGFDKDEVFYAELSQEAQGKKDAIRTELGKLPFVESVGFAQFAVGASDNYMGWGRGNGEHSMSFNVLPCDYGYLATMGIKVLQGRDFTPNDKNKGAYIANQAMMKQYPWLQVGDSIGRQNEWSSQSNYNIVGVCRNFKLKSMRNDNSKIAMAFIVMGPDMEMWGDRCHQVFVRVAKMQDKIEARHRIAKVLDKMDGSQEYEVKFLDEDLQQTYVEEFRFISQVKLFAFICIMITIVGVFSLTMFETEYRRKEIAIRKVMGSTTRGVIRLFAVRYALPLVVAFAVGAPLGWWLGKKWLQSFCEHTPIHFWIFPVAFVAVSAVVILTVVVQSWRVATENPVESIKTE